jgi:hypothetical protein
MSLSTHFCTEQEHWRKITRNDLLTSDPDTPAAHILYTLSKLSHGRLILLSPNSTYGSSNGIASTSSSSTGYFTSGGGGTISAGDIEVLKELPSAHQFTQVWMAHGPANASQK